jgi:hypothetical protein
VDTLLLEERKKMKKKILGVVFCFSFFVPIYGSIGSKIVDDISDTLSTGMPIALFSGIWWAVANRVPRKWADLSDPAATFIRQTWKEQGLAHPEKIILKEIPAHSLFAKVIMYTQELPHALAVGIPFKKRIEKLLREHSFLQVRLSQDADGPLREGYKKRLQEVEDGLAECRFVCGHERVHKERAHTYQMLLIQFIAPFILHSLLKHSANALERRAVNPLFPDLLRQNMTRATLEMLIFWLTAHIFEREADLHASGNPVEIKAGIELFMRARASKGVRKHTPGMRMTVFLWFLKYTHPTTPERLKYLNKALNRAKNRLQKSSMHSSVSGKTLTNG